jgi:hypothetical protein
VKLPAVLASLFALSLPVVGLAAPAVAAPEATAARPAAPKQVQAEASGREVTVRWRPVAGADSYRVYAQVCTHPVGGDQSCGKGARRATVQAGATSATITAKASRRLRLRVTAVVDGRQSTRSTVAVATTVPQSPRGALTAEVGDFAGLYENVRLRRASPYATSVTFLRSVDGQAPEVLGEGTRFERIRWYLNAAEVEGWTAPEGGHDYVYSAVACNAAGCSDARVTGTQRVPYWYAVDRDRPWMHLRFSQSTYGDLEQYSFAAGDGADDDIAFLQCPAFRSCEGSDKAFYLTGRGMYQGMVRRSGGISANLTTESRSFEFFLKSGDFTPGGAIFGHRGADAASSFVLTNGLTPGSLLLNGRPLAQAPVHDGEWHHLVVSYDDAVGRVALHLDGAPVGELEDVDVSTIATADVTLAWAEGAVAGQAGTYDEFAIFDRALTSEEIAAHYAARADGD